MNGEVFGFDLDAPQEDIRIPTYDELLKEYPSLSVQVADEIVYFATKLEPYDLHAVLHLIGRAIEIITTHDMSWDELKWRWMMDAVAEAYLRSKRHERQIQSLFTRLERVESKTKTASSDTVSSSPKQPSPSQQASQPPSPHPPSQFPVPPPYVSKQTKAQGK
jgi:hypothetical protein